MGGKETIFIKMIIIIFLLSELVDRLVGVVIRNRYIEDTISKVCQEVNTPNWFMRTYY